MTSIGPRRARHCSATRSASPRPTSPSSTTTHCWPATAWPSPRTAPPTNSTSTTRSPPAETEREPPGLAPQAGPPDLAVGECSVVEVRPGQQLAFLLVFQQMNPRLAIALFEQDVLRAHDITG